MTLDRCFDCAGMKEMGMSGDRQDDNESVILLLPDPQLYLTITGFCYNYQDWVIVLALETLLLTGSVFVLSHVSSLFLLMILNRQCRKHGVLLGNSSFSRFTQDSTTSLTLHLHFLCVI